MVVVDTIVVVVVNILALVQAIQLGTSTIKLVSLLINSTFSCMFRIINLIAGNSISGSYKDRAEEGNKDQYYCCTYYGCGYYCGGGGQSTGSGSGNTIGSHNSQAG